MVHVDLPDSYSLRKQERGSAGQSLRQVAGAPLGFKSDKGGGSGTQGLSLILSWMCAHGQ